VIWRGPSVEKWRAEKEDVMTKVRVAGFSLSLDGFGAGPEQSIDEGDLGHRQTSFVDELLGEFSCAI
jgi:hypothetical protein